MTTVPTAKRPSSLDRLDSKYMARVKHSCSSVVDANPVAKGNVLQPPAEQQTPISASIEKSRGSGFSSIFAILA
jgi:hypothetical protein